MSKIEIGEYDIITWTKRNNEDLEYEIEELKAEIKKLESEKAIWEFLCVLAIMVLIAILFN